MGIPIMKNLMEHKGYFAKLDYDPEEDLFFGTVVGINDLIMFEGSTNKTLRKAFEESIEEYLSLCLRNNKSPDKTYSGTFNVRVSADMHRQLTLLAASKDANLNSIINEALSHYCQEEENVWV